MTATDMSLMQSRDEHPRDRLIMAATSTPATIHHTTFVVAWWR